MAAIIKTGRLSKLDRSAGLDWRGGYKTKWVTLCEGQLVYAEEMASSSGRAKNKVIDLRHVEALRYSSAANSPQGAFDLVLRWRSYSFAPDPPDPRESGSWLRLLVNAVRDSAVSPELQMYRLPKEPATPDHTRRGDENVTNVGYVGQPDSAGRKLERKQSMPVKKGGLGALAMRSNSWSLRASHPSAAAVGDVEDVALLSPGDPSTPSPSRPQGSSGTRTPHGKAPSSINPYLSESRDPDLNPDLHPPTPVGAPGPEASMGRLASKLPPDQPWAKLLRARNLTDMAETALNLGSAEGPRNLGMTLGGSEGPHEANDGGAADGLAAAPPPKGAAAALAAYKAAEAAEAAEEAESEAAASALLGVQASMQRREVAGEAATPMSTQMAWLCRQSVMAEEEGSPTAMRVSRGHLPKADLSPQLTFPHIHGRVGSTEAQAPMPAKPRTPPADAPAPKTASAAVPKTAPDGLQAPPTSPTASKPEPPETASALEARPAAEVRAQDGGSVPPRAYAEGVIWASEARLRASAAAKGVEAKGVEAKGGPPPCDRLFERRADHRTELAAIVATKVKQLQEKIAALEAKGNTSRAEQLRSMLVELQMRHAAAATDAAEDTATVEAKGVETNGVEVTSIPATSIPAAEALSKAPVADTVVSHSSAVVSTTNAVVSTTSAVVSTSSAVVSHSSDVISPYRAVASARASLEAEALRIRMVARDKQERALQAQAAQVEQKRLERERKQAEQQKRLVSWRQQVEVAVQRTLDAKAANRLTVLRLNVSLFEGDDERLVRLEQLAGGLEEARQLLTDWALRSPSAVTSAGAAAAAELMPAGEDWFLPLADVEPTEAGVSARAAVRARMALEAELASSRPYLAREITHSLQKFSEPGLLAFFGAGVDVFRLSKALDLAERTEVPHEVKAAARAVLVMEQKKLRTQAHAKQLEQQQQASARHAHEYMRAEARRLEQEAKLELEAREIEAKLERDAREIQAKLELEAHKMLEEDQRRQAEAHRIRMVRELTAQRDALLATGHALNTAGDFTSARAHFLAAGELHAGAAAEGRRLLEPTDSERTVPAVGADVLPIALLSAANMAFKLGQRELACAEYTSLLERPPEAIGEKVRALAVEKLAAARLELAGEEAAAAAAAAEAALEATEAIRAEATAASLEAAAEAAIAAVAEPDESLRASAGRGAASCRVESPTDETHHNGGTSATTLVPATPLQAPHAPVLTKGSVREAPVGLSWALSWALVVLLVAILLALTTTLTVTSSRPQLVENEGIDCWSPCGNRSGACPGFCGAGGACCRPGRDKNNVACRLGTLESSACPKQHCCVAAFGHSG